MPKLKHLRHERFCREYVSNGYNATKAARAVGAPSNSAHSQGSDYLKKPEIINRIMELNDNLLTATVMTPEDIAAELSAMASFNPVDLTDEEGQPIPLHELPRSVAVGAQEMVLTKLQDGRTAYVVEKAGKDKRAALDMLAKHHNWFAAHQESGKAEMKIVISEKDEQL